MPSKTCLNFARKIGQSLSTSLRLTSFWSSHCITPLFYFFKKTNKQTNKKQNKTKIKQKNKKTKKQKKKKTSLIERRLFLSCCPSIPVTSKVECPPGKRDGCHLAIFVSTPYPNILVLYLKRHMYVITYSHFGYVMYNTQYK